MPVEKRTYGQGAQGEPENKSVKSVSLLAKIKYGFDNLTASATSFVAVLAIFALTLTAIITSLSYLNGDNELQDPAWIARPDWFDRYWLVFGQMVIGYKKADSTLALDRSLAIVEWLGTTSFNAFILAFITAKLIEFMNRIKRGRSSIIVQKHTLILGWSNRIFPLLKELNIAHAGSKSTVVVLSEKDRAAMDTEIDSRAGKLKNLKIVTRSGDISNPSDLARMNVANAKSVVLLDSESGSDANVVATVLAIKAAGGSSVPVIAEIDDSKVGKSLRSATSDQVIPIRSDDIIARVTAQASRQLGLGAVVLDLLDFDGAEMYFTNVPALVGKTYGEALLGFNESSVIGLITAAGETKLNPDKGIRLATGDRLIVIAEDDTKVVYTGTRDDLLKRISKSASTAMPKPANLLVIGWSFMGEAVLNELAGFLPKGSSVSIVVHNDLVSTEAFKGKKWGNLKVSHKTVSGDVDELVSVTKGQKFDEIIVLGYRKGISAADADAHTMLTMLQLNQLQLKSKSGEETRLIAEILDSRKAGLARVAAEGDLVISDNLGALLIAQLSENPELAPVFDDLFGAGGVSILINPIQSYAALGKEVSYGELVAAASDQGESAIGYRNAASSNLDGSTGVLLNPSKNQTFAAKPGDALVVIGKF